MKKILVLLLLIAACQPAATNNLMDIEHGTPLEDGVTADKIAVFGVMLNDSEQEILELHGDPRERAAFAFTKINLHYDFGGHGDTTVLYHLENDQVTGILVTNETTDFTTDQFMDLGEDNMFTQFGKPTATRLRPHEVMYIYDELGYEIFTKNDDINRIYLTFPNRGIEPAGEANNETCEKEITPAMDSNGTCVEFPNPCVVPDNWRVVDVCE